MLLHPLYNFLIQKYYQNKSKFNGAYSRNNLPKIKDGYVVNLDEYEAIQTCGIALCKNGDHITYFDCFGVEYILKEAKKFIGNKHL